MVVNKQDEELNLLLTRLYAIQEQVGATEKTSEDEKRLRAQQAGQSSITMGSSKKSKKKGSRFIELKSSIVDALRTVHTLIDEQSKSKRVNPKEVIAAQAEIREYIRKAEEEWDEEFEHALFLAESNVRDEAENPPKRGRR